MADKQEFLNELSEHIQTLQAWLKEIGEEINARTKSIGDLEEQRRNGLEEAAVTLLPNLEAQTLADLNGKLPKFITSQQIKETRVDEESAIEDQIDELPEGFDPAACEEKKTSLQLKIETELESKKVVDSALRNLNNIGGFAQLIECGYGTTSYPRNFWQFQYYSDWKRADEIVDLLKKNSWDKIADHYHRLSREAETANQSIGDSRREIEALTQNQARLEELKRALDSVDNVVLEKLRVKLKAKLDSLDPPPDWLIEISRNNQINEQITESRRIINEDLQPRRERVSEQMTKLQSLRTAVTKSRQKKVPDKYLAALRSQTSPTRRRSDDWLSTYLYYDLMFNHFQGSEVVYETPVIDRQIVTEENYGRVS